MVKPVKAAFVFVNDRFLLPFAKEFNIPIGVVYAIFVVAWIAGLIGWIKVLF